MTPLDLTTLSDADLLAELASREAAVKAVEDEMERRGLGIDVQGIDRTGRV